MKSSRVVTLLLVVAGLSVGLIVLVAAGLVDDLAHDGQVDRRAAIGCLLAYWLVASVAVAALAYASTHWRELLLSLGATVLTLGLAEAVLRVMHVPRALPRYAGLSSKLNHHINPANRRMFVGAYEGHPIIVRTNEDGLRTNYTRATFRKYHHRVVVLGDSFVFGSAVRQERTLTAIMEQWLREHLGADQVAVLNAGIISYSPFLEWLLFVNKLKEYRPTLVILLLDATDIGDDIQYQAEARRDTNGIHFDVEDQEEPGYHSAVVELVRPLLDSIPPEHNPLLALAYPFRRPSQQGYPYYKFEVAIGGVVETNRFFIYRHPLEETCRYFVATLENINAVAREAQQINATFLLAVSPRFQHWNPAEAPENWESFAYTVHEPYQYEYFRFFEEARSQLDYPILNLLPAFQATHEFPLVFPNDPHWNERGHAFVARVLVNYLLEMKLIER